MGASLRAFRRGYRTLRDAGVGRVASLRAALRVAFGPDPKHEDWPEA